MAAQNGHPSEEPNFGVRVSVFFGALFLVYGVFVPYLPVWLDSRGLTAMEISTVIAAPFFIRVFFTPVVTHLADRIGNYRLVAMVMAWSALVFVLLLSRMHGYWPIFLFAVMFLLATTAMMPLIETIAVAGVRIAGLDYGRMRAWGSVAFVAANLVGGVVLDQLGAPISVWLLAIAAALTVMAAHLLPGPQPGSASPAPVTFYWRTSLPMRLLSLRLFVIFLVAIGCLHGAHATLYTFGSLHWEAQGLSAAWVGALWAIGVIAEVILFAYSGPLVQRFGPVELMVAGSCAAVVRWSVMAFDPPLAVLIPLQTLHALTFGAAHVGAILFITRAVPHVAIGSAQALLAVVAAGLGVGTVGLISGPLYASLGGQAFLLPAALGLIGLGASLAVLKGWSGGLLWTQTAASPKDPAPAG